CSSTTTRKEIKSMSSAELNKYFNALKRMNSGSRPNQFDRFAQVHVWFAGQIHGYASFFPFHRQMLRDWEQTLQRVSGDPSVFQPYWDWTQDSQNPSASRVLSTSLFGGNSNGGCANIPNLGGQWPVFWDGNYQVRQRCLQRNFDNNAMRAYSSKSAIQTIMRSTNSFEQFAPAIEGSPHGMIHVSIGGDMNTMASPNDPIFWLHHAFIDKMWADWIDQNPGARQWSYGGRNQDGSGAGYYDALPYYGNPVWTVMPLGNMCYNY
ncbi:Di-copper centre-containing protein, partial [Ramicandelaber brevisporus]